MKAISIIFIYGLMPIFLKKEKFRDNVCYSPGAPEYRFSTNAGLNHIPKI